MAEFDWLPYLEGKYLTYYQIMCLIFSTLCVFISLICFVVYLLLQKYHIRLAYARYCFKFMFYSLSFIPLVCMAADLWGFAQGVVGMAIVLGIGEFVENYAIGSNKKRIRYQQVERQLAQQSERIKDKKLIFDNKIWSKIAKILMISLLCNAFFYKTCISFYNNEIGIQSKLFGVTINTYLMRLLQLKTSCPPGPPCELYTTIPEDPYQAFFLNVHTHVSVDKVIVYYKQLLTQDIKNNDRIDKDFTFMNVTAECFHYQGLQWKTARNVHSALIMGLKPNTKYLLKVFYDNQYWTNAIYKTLPNDTSYRVRMVNGGDSGYCPGAVKLSKIVAKLNPDIFFMGGDIAYDNNIPACSYTWDYFLNMYGQITTTLGYLMPIVTSVGNHDAGINELPGINITVNSYGPAFLIYFPQHYDRNGKFQIVKKVPPIEHRRTVTGFTFSNIHFLILDSGYLHGFDGWQKSYMIRSLQQNKDKLKFVNYHVPIYGSCEAFDKNPQRFLYALFHWVPIFDKFKVMTVFENHVHAFKRTKPLIASSPVPSGGTVYLGDGSYGAFNQLACHPDASIGIFQKFNSNNNFWLTDVHVDKVIHTCYNSEGKIIDQFTQNVSEYRLTDQQIQLQHKNVESLLPTKDIFAKTIIQ